MVRFVFVHVSELFWKCNFLLIINLSLYTFFKRWHIKADRTVLHYWAFFSMKWYLQQLNSSTRLEQFFTFDETVTSGKASNRKKRAGEIPRTYLARMIIQVATHISHNIPTSVTLCIGITYRHQSFCRQKLKLPPSSLSPSHLPLPPLFSPEGNPHKSFPVNATFQPLGDQFGERHSRNHLGNP